MLSTLLYYYLLTNQNALNVSLVNSCYLIIPVLGVISKEKEPYRPLLIIPADVVCVFVLYIFMCIDRISTSILTSLCCK